MPASSPCRSTDRGPARRTAPPSAGRRARTAATVALASAVALVATGCITVQTPPSAALPCDPALVGQWQLTALGVSGAMERAEPMPASSTPQPVLYIDAQCLLRSGDRQVQLHIYEADGHRYLGADAATAIPLLAGGEGEGQQLAEWQAWKARFPDAVALARYQAAPGHLDVDLGHPGDLPEFKAATAIDPATGKRKPGPVGEPLTVLGDAAQIRAKLDGPQGAFGRPEFPVVHRYTRLKPSAP